MRMGLLIVGALVAAMVVLASSGGIDFDRSREEVCRPGPPLAGSRRGQSRFDHLVCR
jgi:hypothetical protein